MALDPKYIVTSDLEGFFIDKDTALPLANGQLIFYHDNARNVPKAVFELSGTPPSYTYTSLGAVVQLSNSGTVQDASGANQVIYYYPYDTSGNVDLYYVVCEDANGVVQFTREAWPNVNSSGSSSSSAISPPANNQLSNPQFLNFFINSSESTTLTVASAFNQVFPLCPDWDIVLTGSGSVVISIVPIAGSANIPTSPPYALDIQVDVGITNCYLTQTIPYNSGLWSSTATSSIYLAGGFAAQNQSGGAATVQMFYAQSSGSLSTSPVQIMSASVTSLYAFFQGGTASAIPESADSALGEQAYVQIYVSIPPLSHIQITSIELIASFTAYSSTSPIPYDLNSSNRNEAYQGDYYIPNLSAKQISSYLIGWDFPLNPFQFGSSGTLTAGAFGYLADQTIYNAIGSNVAWSSTLPLSPLSLSPTDSGAIYLMQYLNGNTVKKMAGTPLCSNVFAYLNGGSATVNMKIYLFSAPGNSAIPNTYPVVGTIGTLASDGTFTLSSTAISNGWSAIPRSGLSIPIAGINSLATYDQINDGLYDYGFSQWQITDATQIQNVNNFAMIVTFSYSAAITINVSSISLVPGNIPCRPAIQSPDEVLRQCLVYYQDSFVPTFVGPPGPGGSLANASIGTQGISNAGNSTGPIIKFLESMRVAPHINLYNPFNNNNFIYDVRTSSDWTSTNAQFVTQNGFYTIGASPGSVGDLVGISWVADARLGLI